MQATNFNLIDVSAVIKQQFKQIALFVCICVLVTTTLVFILPKYYKSTAIVVAANPALADKARLFNNNIQGLYSNFGSGDDLDRIDGLANLDTTFKLLVKEFNLTEYYQLTDDSIALKSSKAVLNLRDDIILQKTELGQYKIIVSTKNKQLSANVANKMVAIVQDMIEKIWQSNYTTSLSKINNSIKDLETEVDSLNKEIATVSAFTIINKRDALLQQLKQYYTTANEFKLAISNNTPALYISEIASPAAKHDKPKKLTTIIASAFASLLFGCFIALLFARKIED